MYLTPLISRSNVISFIDADAIVGYNKAFTVQVPVTAVEQSDATVSVSPSPILSPAIGEPLTLSLNITHGKNVAGYQAIVLFDGSTLDYVKSTNGDYLPANAFFGDPIIVHDWLGETHSVNLSQVASISTHSPQAILPPHGNY